MHDENAPEGVATMLARMTYPELPVPIGIFRSQRRPSFEAMMHQQVKTAKTKKSTDLQAYITGSDTWTVA